MRTIAIGSGKGGVGKTTLTANLAIGLQRRGLKVLAMDADFGLANLDVVLGLAPGPSLLDLIHNHCDVQSAIRWHESGVAIIAGSSGSAELANMSPEALGRLLNQLQPIEEHFDYLLVDVAAGVHETAIATLCSADEILLTLCQDPSSFIDAYATIKSAQRLNAQVPFSVVVNNATSASDAKLFFARFAAITKERLFADVQYAGCVPYDPEVQQYALRRSPILVANAKSVAARAIVQLASFISKTPEPAHAQERAPETKGFFRKLLNALNNGAVIQKAG